MIRLLHALDERCDLLGIALAPSALLALDALVVLLVAGRVVVRLEGDRPWSRARRLLASGVVSFAVVVGSVTLLGAARVLSARHLLISHVALALFAVVIGQFGTPRRWWRTALTSLALPIEAALAPWRAVLDRNAWRRERRVDSALLASVLALLVGYLLLAALTLPLNYDANTYRLSRVAMWLQNGSVYHLDTNDVRQNFTGQNADFVMTWIVSFFRRGYPLVGLVQFAGGLLACAAVWEICAQLGLARRWRLAGIAVLIGTPTAGTQFFTAQTDLFAGGCLAAGTAFLLPALRERRAAFWLLLGIGGGVALGAKATILYWAPGLAMVGLGWARLERTPLRRLASGMALALLAAVPWFVFNFVLNQWEFEQPVAPKASIARSVKPVTVTQGSWLAANVLAFGWQSVDPASNPWLPRGVSERWATALFERLVATWPENEGFRHQMEASAEWFRHGLSEDYASFGLLVTALGVGGFGFALGRLLLGRQRRRAGEAALLALGVAAYVVVACIYQPMTTFHQFRYFCLVAPATAVVAAYALAGIGSSAAIAGRAVALVLMALQLATAAYIGLESRHHGWSALLRPQSAPNYPLWAETRGTIKSLGERPLRVAVALPRDSWLAPLFRSGVDHRIEQLTWTDFRDSRCLSRALAWRDSEVLIASQRMLAALWAVDVWVQEAPGAQLTGLLVARWAGRGTVPLPPTVRAVGVFSDGWTATRATFEIAGCARGRYGLAFGNPTPLTRQVRMRSGRESATLELAPGAGGTLEIEVLERDRVRLEVTPPFVPAAVADSPDERRLGLRVGPPEAIVMEGIDGDGWTRPEVRLQLAGWYSGPLVLQVSNPTPLARRISARSGAGETRIDLPPGGSRRLELPVLFADHLTLSVRPGYRAPASDPATADPRELGLLLSAEDLERLSMARR